MLTYEELTYWSHSELVDMARDFADLNFEEWDSEDLIEFILDNIND